MRVLVTGGAGFIGSNLVQTLLNDNFVTEVVVIDDFSTGDRRNLDRSRSRFVEGSILDERALREATEGVDSIVHLAALPSVPRSLKDPLSSHHANATGTLLVLEAARAFHVKHVIVASSSSVYGSNPKLPKSEFDWTRPLSPYAVTKLATESYALAYGFSYGIRTLALRFFNVYGPRQAADHAYAAVIPKFIDAILRGNPVTVHGDGEQSRDFTYVETVTNLIARALRENVFSTDPVNLAFGTRTTLNELISTLGDIMNVDITVERTEPRSGDVRASQADPSRLFGLFGGIQPIPLAEGLVDTVAWLRRTHQA